MEIELKLLFSFEIFFEANITNCSRVHHSLYGLLYFY
jgi:hypothetical protein